MAKDLEVAIIFADVVGSTQLYDKFGDTKARIKTIGDEVMSTFETVDDAMGAAVMMQSRVTSESRDNGIPVSIRIGCHFGPVVQEQNDIFGAAVHTANRMTSQAKARQIVISGFTVEHMSPDLRRQTRQIDVATVRGRLDEVALYELVWQPEEATSMLPTIEWEARDRRASKLLINFRDQSVELSDKRKSINLGRADDNDLVVKGNLISRIHAKIEMRRGKFVLVDQSTNGSFLQNARGQETFVRRDSTELAGEGTIGLGRAEPPGSNLAIYYKTIE
ncbi:MAG: adenylate/guanylate cyclase domain-containing protein [Woeseiaceae bacterium]